MSNATVKHLRDAREQAAYRFELLSTRLGFTVVKKLTNYRYVVRDDSVSREYTAMVLPCSFDFYEYRLNKGVRRIELLIVQRHNAVVPLRVVSLEHVTDFAPLDAPAIERKDRKRRNHEESMLLVSKLLLNFESAHAELSAMRPRTQQWYLQRCEEYLKARIGRPWAS
ncbi:MAG TPA: hypothetical protein VJO32_05905 [Ktedonobacteraceae bacterium]|nr:hypothetical protein [Ktedonobacteraceae bacterium]